MLAPLAVTYRQPPALAYSQQPAAIKRWWYLLDFILMLMIIGPVLAPLFHNSGIWLFDRIAHWIIYPLGQLICPQDQHAVPIMGTLMAVCTRCYAAIGGLALTRLALTSDPNGTGVGAWVSRQWHRLPRVGRLVFIVGVIALWVLDVQAEQLGLWSWSQPILILTGPIIGFAIGFTAYTLLALITRTKAGWN